MELNAQYAALCHNPRTIKYVELLFAKGTWKKIWDKNKKAKIKNMQNCRLGKVEAAATTNWRENKGNIVVA